MHALVCDDTIGSPATAPETPLPAGRLGYDRKGMILHAARHAMNESRNVQAASALHDLLEDEPSLAKAWALLGSVIGRMGDPEAAIAHQERAVELAPADADLHSTLIFSLDQSPETTLERAYRARRAFNDVVRIDPSEIAPHENDPDPERPLRIGYVSADFRNHSAAYGWGPVLLAHGFAPFESELYAYSSTAEEDDRTRDFKRVVHTWRDVADWDDDRLAARIREDRIDVLVDLSGHSGGNRLRVFARKPAPVQVTGWGYISGTGLDAIDYLFADADTVLPAEEQWYAEEVFRLPRILTCWAPDAGAVGMPVESPHVKNGYLTFGSMNRVGKIQPQVASAWAQILRRLPDARLLIKAPGLEDADAQAMLRATFERADAPLSRIEMRGLTPQIEHLRTFHEIDVHLDCSPHGGGMTTLDAAWMGAPTLTLPHRQIVSRIATTVNRELGLNFLVADSWSDYVGRAVALDQQREELRKVRRLMRDVMSVSAFGDHVSYATRVEAAYREMWRRWCAGDAPQKSGLRVVA